MKRGEGEAHQGWKRNRTRENGRERMLRADRVGPQQLGQPMTFLQ